MKGVAVDRHLRYWCQSVLEYEDDCEDEEDVLFASFTRPRRRPRTRVLSNILDKF